MKKYLMALGVVIIFVLVAVMGVITAYMWIESEGASAKFLFVSSVCLVINVATIEFNK